MKTYRIDRLYFKLIKGGGLDLIRVQALALELVQAGFIELVDGGSRYKETAKMSEGLNKSDLFKIVQRYKS